MRIPFIFCWGYLFRPGSAAMFVLRGTCKWSNGKRGPWQRSWVSLWVDSWSHEPQFMAILSLWRNIGVSRFCRKSNVMTSTQSLLQGLAPSTCLLQPGVDGSLLVAMFGLVCKVCLGLVGVFLFLQPLFLFTQRTVNNRIDQMINCQLKLENPLYENSIYFFFV